MAQCFSSVNDYENNCNLSRCLVRGLHHWMFCCPHTHTWTSLIEEHVYIATLRSPSAWFHVGSSENVWLVVWNMFYFSHHIGNVIIPTDELIFFRGVGIPPTRCCTPPKMTPWDGGKCFFFMGCRGLLGSDNRENHVFTRNGSYPLVN